MNLASYVKRKYKIKSGEGIYENGMIKFKENLLNLIHLLKKLI